MITKQMKTLIEKRRALNMYDGEEIDRYWKLMLEVLETSLPETIDYIRTAPEEEILWCAEVWDELSQYWKSQELLIEMERCQERFPRIAKDIQVDIDFARKAIQS